MTREELKALGLSDEQIDAVMLSHGKVVNATKEQAESLTEAKKKLEADIAERDKQLETLKADAGTSEELKEQIAKLQADNKTAKEQYESELQELKLNNAIHAHIRGKVHDEALVTGLLDRDKLVIDGDKVVGLEDQLKGLQESKGFLFKSEEDTKSGFNKVGSDGEGSPPGDKPVSLKDAIASHFNK